MSSSNKKRLDLQGIRGFAIISVIGFHFFPSTFPNGYYGVDQFFVLSGFLMCMLLQKSVHHTDYSKSSIILNFYIRRLKRILPLYFLVIFLSLICLASIFPSSAYDTNISSAKKALIFHSNQAATQEENYFQLLSVAVNIFTHTWSLSVEVQFYLLVPFLFLIGHLIFQKWFKLYYYLLIGAISILYSIKFCSQEEAFNSVFARVWQFMIGMIVYIAADSGRNVSKIKTLLLKRTLMISMTLLVFSRTEISIVSLRAFFTVGTGILMLFSENDCILSCRILTYIGDISYSLYLVHWPIYAYWKSELSLGAAWNFQLLASLLLSIVLAVLSYEIYEKWYLKLTQSKSVKLCLLLIFLNVIALNKREITDIFREPPPRLDGLAGNHTYTFNEAEYLNEKWSRLAEDDLTLTPPSCVYEKKGAPFGWCRHKGFDGEFKMMLIGNSWAPNHARVIADECGYRAKSLLQGAIRGCDPIHSHNYGGDVCKMNVKEFEDRIIKENPDYLFVITRFVDVGEPLTPNITRIEDDIIYKSMKQQMAVWEQHVKRNIFVLTSIPVIQVDQIANIVNAVKNKEDLLQFDKNFIKTDPQYARLRHEKLIEECGKCIKIDYKPIFFNEDTNTWRFYDVKNSGLSYVTTYNHLNPHGLELIRNVYTDICSKL